MRGRLLATLRNERGLTLLEVIIATTILGLIVLILGAALQISYNTIQTGSRHRERIHRARVITDKLAQELRSAYRFSRRGATEEIVAFLGEPDRFSLVTTASMHTQGLIQSGLKEVTFGLEDDAATGRRGLVMWEDVIPHGELFEEGKGHRIVLDPAVVALRYRYFGSPEDEGETPRPDRWEERWESARPPKAVEVRLTLHEPQEAQPMELPPITVAVPVEHTVEVEKK